MNPSTPIASILPLLLLSGGGLFGGSRPSPHSGFLLALLVLAQEAAKRQQQADKEIIQQVVTKFEIKSSEALRLAIPLLYDVFVKLSDELKAQIGFFASDRGVKDKA